MMYALLNSLARRFAGRHCRACGEQLLATDPFGVSEGVCRGCRT
jgi:hypothetical protein